MNKANLFKILRIVCSLLAAAAAAACVFMFVFLGPFWGVATIVIAFIFFALTLLFKTLQESEENKSGDQKPRGDYITGPVPLDNPDDGKPNTDGEDKERTDK